jgi:Holliday junction resolvase RusA-like endonuclease
MMGVNEMGIKLSYNKEEYSRIYKLSLNIIPSAQARPRTGSFGHFFVPNAKKEKNLVQQVLYSKYPEFRNKDFLPSSAEVELVIDLYIPIPKIFSKKELDLAEQKLIRPITNPDWDNYGKTYSDALNEIFFYSDGKITTGIVRKFYCKDNKPKVKFLILIKDNIDSNNLMKTIDVKKKTLQLKPLKNEIKDIKKQIKKLEDIIKNKPAKRENTNSQRKEKLKELSNLLKEKEDQLKVNKK